MPVVRHRQAERFEQQDLPRRVGEVILTAQHMGHAHQAIIDSIAEKERGAAIAATNHEITDVITGKALRPAHQIFEFNETSGRDAKPPGRRQALCALGLHLLRCKVRTSARIAWRTTRGALRLACHFQLHCRAETGINLALLLQLCRFSLIYRGTLRLCVGLVCATHSRSFLPIQAEPVQIGLQILGKLFTTALGIRVLDAQQEHAIAALRQQPAEQRRAHIAEVQLAGGAGRETGFHKAVSHGAPW